MFRKLILNVKQIIALPALDLSQKSTTRTPEINEHAH